MTDTARVLLTAGLLSVSAAAVFAGRLRGLDPAVGMLRWAPHAVDTLLFAARQL